MDYKKVLFGIFAAIWIAGVLIQQIYWISTGIYNIVTFIWAIVELGIIYLVFKLMEED